jgi:hypothetical protein
VRARLNPVARRDQPDHRSRFGGQLAPGERRRDRSGSLGMVVGFLYHSAAELRRAGRAWDDRSKWALANEAELRRLVEAFIAGPHPLDTFGQPEGDLAKVLDDPRRAAGLLNNKDAMARLLHECRENHREHAGSFAEVRRERNLATDRVLEAIRAGGIEPRTLVSIIDRSASPMSQEATPVIGVAPIPFNDPDGGDDLIAKWAKWPGKKGKPPGAKTVYEARRMMRKLLGFVGFDDLARLTRRNVEDWIELLMSTEVISDC